LNVINGDGGVVSFVTWSWWVVTCLWISADGHVARCGEVSGNERRRLGDTQHCRLEATQHWILSHLRHSAVSVYK